MTTTPHEIRNWLHQLLSSIEAAMPDVTAQCFAQQSPLEVVTPFEGYSFTEWQPLASVLNQHLEGLPPGAVRYRLIENVSLVGDTLPPEMALPVEVQWRVALFRRGSDQLTRFHCAAILIREAGDLAAIRLLATFPEPDPPITEEDPPTETSSPPPPEMAATLPVADEAPPVIEDESPPPSEAQNQSESSPPDAPTP